MMRFAILGSVEVWAGERRVGVSGPRQLGLLSFLLLHRNRMVSRDALMDALWGEDAGIGDKRLQMAIARLRKQLEPPDGEGERRLRTISGGYLLAVEPGELDADAFADLVTDGRAALDAGDPGLASRILGQALALWRGPPLPEVAFADFAQPEIRRLEELRLSTFELLIDAEMQLGHHAAVIAEVEEELAGDPTREALVGRLMLALYRAGRQTDALAVYQRTRLHLDQELGLEPSEELKALQVQILEHAPSLEPDRLGTAGVTRRPVLPAGTVTLVFTDVEGSTRLLGELGSERYAGELRSHHELVREVVTAHGGVEVKSEGDGFFLAFARASDALEAAEALQAGSVGRRMRARVGIHTGEPLLIDGDYVGMDVHKAARISDAAHGGQVVVSQATRDLAGDDGLCELGEYRLKDLTAPERLFQLGTTQFPELRSLNRLNLPVPTSPIVGRREETAAALELLARADVRLVTLLGPGGSGKTRLAVEVAAQAVARYRDGVWMVLLASIRDGSLLTGEIARVLEIEPVAGERAEQTLVSALAERELLLVLDNTEHLPQTGALVAALLAAAPRVDVLCTSREPLRIRAEQRMDVGPLRREDASELFVARALAVRPDLKLDDRDRAAIGRICSRLDDLPLALELAAARIAAFKPTALEARLAERLSLPVAIEDLPARQQTLRATIDWSYRLLNPEEREMLESLAPFIGGVRLDTAESVWGPHALDLVLSLAEKSLLRRREDSDGETRLWMLETVREFVSEQSAAHASVDANADRHAAYFCELAAEAAPSMTTSDQARWLDRLNDEQPNLRAAMDRYMLVAPERALAMAASQIWFWEIRGYMHESRERLSAVLESTHGDSGDRAVALFGAGRMAALLGDPTAAEQSLGESARIARAVGNTGLAALALSNLVWAYLLLGDDQRGAASAAEAATLARSSGDPWVLATVLNNEGDTFAARGEFERARPLLEESLAIRRGIGDPRVLALSAANLAPLLLGAGELDAAEAILTEGLAHARAIAHGPLTLSLLSTAALAALQRNDLARTHEGLAAASEEISPDTDAESGAIFLSAAAALAASRNDPHTAATLWAATDVALHDAARVEVPAAAALRAELLPHVRAAAVDRWDDAWSAGTRLTLHAALGYATRSLTGTPSASGPLT